MDTDDQLAVIANGWPAISDADLTHLFNHLARRSQVAGEPRVTRSSDRPMASAALASLPDGSEIFVKRYSPALITSEQLEAKHGYVNRLVDLGFPTVQFLNFDDDSTIFDDGRWLYEANPKAPGEDRYRELTSWLPPKTRAEMVEIGRIAGRLRELSDEIPIVDLPASRGGSSDETAGSAVRDRLPGRGRPPSLGWEQTPDQRRDQLPGPGLARSNTAYQTKVRLLLGEPSDDDVDAWLAAHPGVRSYLEKTGRDFAADLRLASPFADRLAELGSGPQAWTHGDLHASNTLWRGDQITSVIDFGLAWPNPPLLDLAMAIERHAIDWLAITAGDGEAWRPEAVDDVIGGYRRTYPLPAAEGEVLADLVACCQVEFALTNIEYASLAPVDPSVADWSYEVYFRDHLRWFGTDAGHRFAEAVRNAAP